MNNPSASRLLLLLIVATVVVYLPVVQLDFAWDDHALVGDYAEILANPRLLLAALFSDLWSAGDVSFTDSGYYRPLMLLSLAVDRALFGDGAWGYHIHSVLWHLLTVVLLHRLLSKLLRPTAALCGAALFALHPIHAEAVIWIAARNDLIAAALGLATLLVLWPLQAGAGRLLGGAVLAMLAVLGKESALLLPGMLLLLDWARSEGIGWRRLAAVVAGVLGALALRAVSGVGSGGLPAFPVVVWFLQQLPGILALQFSMLLWPWPLSGARSVEWLNTPVWMYAVSIALVLAGVLLTARLPKKPQRTALAGLGIAALGFAPALLPLMLRGLLGERYLYLPMAGMGIWLAAVGQHWLRPAAGVALAVMVGGAVVINIRIPDWLNDSTLWTAAIEDTPNPYVYSGMAHTLNKKDEDGGDYRMASKLFVAALEADVPALDACGVVVTSTLYSGNPREAVAVAAWSLEQGCPRDGDYVGRLSVAQAFAGDWAGARETVEAGPADPSRRDDVVRGALLLREGDTEGYAALRETWDNPERLDGQVNRLMEVR